MSDLRELYQEVILDHNKHPRNFGELEGADRHADGYNPLCGDRLAVYLNLDGNVITDVNFLGSGCAISKASASLMTDAVKEKRLPRRVSSSISFVRWSPMTPRTRTLRHSESSRCSRGYVITPPA